MEVGHGFMTPAQEKLDGTVPPSEEVERRGLSRQAILDADDLSYEWVDVPEWGGEVCVRTLTAKERGLFEESVQKGRGTNTTVDVRQIRVRLVALCAVEEPGGERLFPSSADIELLGAKSSSALERVFNAARKLSKIGDEFIEELAGNSATTQNGSASSDSL
jgi:hypothetical protein